MRRGTRDDPIAEIGAGIIIEQSHHRSLGDVNVTFIDMPQSFTFVTTAESLTALTMPLALILRFSEL